MRMALFSGELNELKVVHNVLKAINFKEVIFYRRFWDIFEKKKFFFLPQILGIYAGD